MYDPNVHRLMIGCDKDIMSELKKVGLGEERADLVCRTIWTLLGTKLELASAATVDAAYQRGDRDGFRRGINTRERFEASR